MDTKTTNVLLVEDEPVTDVYVYLIKSTDVWKSIVLHIRDAIERKKGIETLKNGGKFSGLSSMALRSH